MATLIKDFRGARAAVDLVFQADIRLTLDRDSNVLQCEPRTRNGKDWIDFHGVPIGKPYESTHRLMGGLTVESICL